MPFHPECSHHFNAHSGTFTLAPRTLAPNHDIASAVQHAGRRRLCASPTSPADIPGERRGNCHSVPVRVGNGRQIFVNRHSRQLASRERVGRFSRGIAWDLITSFARRHWIILFAALFLPIVAFLPLFFLEHVPARWITVGAAGISGPWIVAVMTILMSGAADPFMGLDAEASTADELRRLRRHGWKLANGIKIREKEDIDHLVVGPAGLLVVESKWSRHRWPLGDQSQSFMSARLSDAVAQVLRNRKDVSTQDARLHKLTRDALGPEHRLRSHRQRANPPGRSAGTPQGGYRHGRLQRRNGSVLENGELHQTHRHSGRNRPGDAFCQRRLHLGGERHPRSVLIMRSSLQPWGDRRHRLEAPHPATNAITTVATTLAPADSELPCSGNMALPKSTVCDCPARPGGPRTTYRRLNLRMPTHVLLEVTRRYRTTVIGPARPAHNPGPPDASPRGERWRSESGVLCLRRSDGHAPVAMAPKNTATLGARCRDCPQRQRCTTRPQGRMLSVNRHHDLLAVACRQARTETFQIPYRQWRPMVERSIAWLVAHGNRRVRFRGVEKNQIGLSLRLEAINLRRMVNLGLDHDGRWLLSPT